MKRPGPYYQALSNKRFKVYQNGPSSFNSGWLKPHVNATKIQRTWREYQNNKKKPKKPKPVRPPQITVEVQTQRRKLKGAGFSKSSGFLRKQRKVKKDGGIARYNRLGTSQTIEKGGVIDAGPQTATLGNTIAVGHATVPSKRCLKMLIRALVKHLFIKHGREEMQDWESAIPRQTPGTGEVVTLKFYTDTELPTISQVVAFFNSTQTYESVTSQLYNDLSNYVTQPQFMDFISIETSVGGDYTLVNLKTSYIHYYAKSSLKVQNRTINSEGGEQDSVDNVPLYGKMYFGKGNGTGAINKNNVYANASRDFIADDQTGTIAKVPTEKWYQEPCSADILEKVSKVGKVHLEPGQIKTSVLKTKFTMTLSRFIREFFFPNFGSGTIKHHRHYFGNFRFMILEKMITSIAGTSVNSVKCAYENNLEIGCYITSYRNTTTAQVVDLYNLANES